MAPPAPAPPQQRRTATEEARSGGRGVQRIGRRRPPTAHTRPQAGNADRVTSTTTQHARPRVVSLSAFCEQFKRILSRASHNGVCVCVCVRARGRGAASRGGGGEEVPEIRGNNNAGCGRT